MLSPTNPLIYAVDNDENERSLLKAAFDHHFTECTLRLFTNGADLLVHLTHQLDRRLPDLIILDLELPIFSGFELLHILKNNEDFRLIPVYILSAIRHTDSIQRCHELGSSNFLYKDKGRAQLISCIQRLQAIWLDSQEKVTSPIKPSLMPSNFVNTSYLSVN
jgi:CheY-like chemotaxis protein